ncbi:MAG: hypothetical protein WKF96_00130 [Solirubrobacteraceae bacterium]
MESLDGLKRARAAAATRACEILMDSILGEAQRIAPLQEGTLAGSATRETDSDGTSGATVTGGFHVVYAEVQHERTDFVHPGGKQAKYLEMPAKKIGARAPAIIAAAVNRATS